MIFNDFDIVFKQKEFILLNLVDLMFVVDFDEFNFGDDEDEGEFKNEDYD